MEEVMADFLETGDVQGVALSALHSESKEDRLLVLGMLMHASISNNQEFADALMTALAEAIGNGDYAEEVKVACFAKLMREVGSLELFGLKVNQEAVFSWLSLIEPWTAATVRFEPALQRLFADAMSSLLTYVNRLPFTLRLLPWVLRLDKLLPQPREGLFRLSLSDFTTLTQYETKQIAEILPVLKSTCELANSIKPQLRYPLIEVIFKALVHQIESKLPKNEANINTMGRYLLQYCGLFTLTQKNAIRQVYLKAAETANVTPDSSLLQKFGTTAAVAQYQEEAKEAAPTVANKCKEFLTALKNAKKSGYVETGPFASMWRNVLFVGEGVVPHQKLHPEVIEEMIALLEADKKRNERTEAIWKLVIGVMNEMGFKEVDCYRDLVASVRLYVSDNSTPHRGRPRPR